jgi:hypothetical protein
MENKSSKYSQNCSIPNGAAEILFEVAYYYCIPLCLLIGIVGHTTYLIVCIKETKKEQAYFYQVCFVVIQVTQSLLGIFSCACAAILGFVGLERQSSLATWFKSNYFCMWYYAHLSSPILNSLMTTLLLLSVCTTADRIYALYDSSKYASSNHKRRRAVTVVLCLLLGFLSSFHDCFRKNVITTNNSNYELDFNKNVEVITILNIFSQIRNGLRLLGLVILLIFNAILLCLYKNRFIKPQRNSMVNRSETQNMQRKESGKVLLILTLYQSVISTVTLGLVIVFYILVYTLPDFVSCGVLLMSPITDLACELSYAMDFYVLVLISTKFRKLVIDHVFKW